MRSSRPGRASADTAAHDDEPPAREEAPCAVDALDPATRHLAQLAPSPLPLLAPTAAADHVAASPPRSLEELVPQLVRRIAWGGDGRRGTVRLELGAGTYTGASVVVHAEGARVRVELTGLPEAELDALRQRLDARLRRHGLDVESVA